MRNWITIFFTTLTILHVSRPLGAQSVVQTVNRTTTKNIPIAPNEILNIIGEKTSIILTGWDKNYIQLKITFSATHADKKIALQELEFMHYSLARDKRTIELRNAFIFPSKVDQIRSKLEVLIEIMFPSANHLILKNKYGDADVRNLSGKIDGDLEFSDLFISHVSGEITMRSSYSEIRGDHILVSSFVSEDEESKYRLELEKGSYLFSSKHCDLDLAVNDVESIIIDATRTDVTLHPKEFGSCNYQLLNKEGKIYLPSQHTSAIKKEGKESSVMLKSKPTNPLINIKTTFNTITIH